MIRYLRNGIGKPANSGMIPIGISGFDSLEVRGYSYNIQKAQQLLADAGYPDGKAFQPLVLHSNPQYQDLTDFIAKSLEDIGINVTVQLSPGSFLRETLRKNEADFFRASWIGDYPDGENYLALFYSGYEAPPNYTFFNHPGYDELYRKALKERNEEKLLAIYHQMERIIINEAPVVPLFYDEIIRFSGPRVEYLFANSMNMLVLKSVRMK
jgi:peptide/nickel transport system substrate-binding protein